MCKKNIIFASFLKGLTYILLSTPRSTCQGNMLAGAYWTHNKIMYLIEQLILRRFQLSYFIIFFALVYPNDVKSQEVSSIDSLSASVPESIQSKKSLVKQKIKHTGNILVRFVKSFNEMDTAYITPNYYNYAAMMQNTNFYQSYRLRATNEEGHCQSIRFAPAPNFKIGPYFGWRWIFLGYTFDLGNPNNAEKSSEFNLSLYSSMLGGDLVYTQHSGDFRIKRVSGFGPNTDKKIRNLDFNGVDTYTACINLYYVFNHTRFSYPAAFAQSTVQRKSCGSWMLGFRFDKQRTHFDYTQLPSDMLSPKEENDVKLIDEMKLSKLEYKNYSVSVGYAYNWVFAKNFLLSASLAPSIGFTHRNGERFTGESLWQNVTNFSFDFVSRLGLVWNNTKWFGGVSFINHLYDYRRDRLSLTNSVNYVNIYFGLNFHKRKEYR